LNKNRLAITVFSGNKDLPKDQEAIDCWLKEGVPIDRIAAIEDNWWGPAGTSVLVVQIQRYFIWKDNSREAPKI
jgi:hypothetical protein